MAHVIPVALQGPVASKFYVGTEIEGPFATSALAARQASQRDQRRGQPAAAGHHGRQVRLEEASRRECFADSLFVWQASSCSTRQ
eukprot:6176332-Pleurochrysis_carterae.AAC.2